MAGMAGRRPQLRYGNLMPSGFELGYIKRRMNGPSTHEITQLLQAWGNGDEQALEKLTPLVYEELHQVAHRYMARRAPDHTLQTTALVNEVYLRLVNVRELSWQNRAHFLAVCAKLMRRILTDFARSRRSWKRGGEAQTVSLDESLMISDEPRADLLALDDALNHLEALDLRKSHVVELRFFGGLTVDETAEVLKVSPDTVLRDWRLAKDWLLRELSGEPQ
jgi:RNA polymerase sigma-70 factor (ECF subfamily)